MVWKWIKGILIGLGVFVLLLILTGNVDTAVTITKGFFGGIWTAFERFTEFITKLFN